MTDVRRVVAALVLSLALHAGLAVALRALGFGAADPSWHPPVRHAAQCAQLLPAGV